MENLFSKEIAFKLHEQFEESGSHPEQSSSKEGLRFFVSIPRSLSETEALFKEELFSGHFWKVDSPTRLSSLETTYVCHHMRYVGKI